MTADDDWLWYGGRVCLDFVNTLRDRWTTPRETLREPADLTGWLRAAGLLTAGPARVTESTLRSAVALREAIDRAVRSVADGDLPTAEDLARINEASAASPPPPPRLAVVQGRLTTAAEPRIAPDPTAVLGRVARDAIGLLLAPEARWVRVCGSDRCGLRFVDRSPAHNRRWCSMDRCGNRTKVRRHQARARTPDARAGTDAP